MEEVRETMWWWEMMRRRPSSASSSRNADETHPMLNIYLLRGLCCCCSCEQISSPLLLQCKYGMEWPNGRVEGGGRRRWMVQNFKCWWLATQKAKQRRLDSVARLKPSQWPPGLRVGRWTYTTRSNLCIWAFHHRPDQKADKSSALWLG